MKLNGWQRLWVVYLAVTFVALGLLVALAPEPTRVSGLIPAVQRRQLQEAQAARAAQARKTLFLLWAGSGAAIYGLGWGLGWVRQGFKG